MITSFFYRDYTRPDLPSGPNESPFAGADIAGLAALGKQMPFFRLFPNMYMPVHNHIFKITLLNFIIISFCSSAIVATCVVCTMFIAVMNIRHGKYTVSRKIR